MHCTQLYNGKQDNEASQTIDGYGGRKSMRQYCSWELLMIVVVGLLFVVLSFVLS
jgi:hypothetical protein